MSKSMLFLICIPILSIVLHTVLKCLGKGYMFTWFLSGVVSGSSMTELSSLTDFHAQRNLLLIGILSAQNNFHLREVLRNTWLRSLPRDISYYFVLGRHTCSIPPEDRIDEFSCEQSYINFPDENLELLQSGLLQCSERQERKQMFWGYNFITLYDVVIHKFGVINSLRRGSMKITLQTAVTREVLTSVLVPSKQNNSSAVLWVSTDTFFLPKGFEGRVTVEKNFSSDEWSQCGFNWQSSGSLLRFLYLFNSPNELPIGFSSETLSPIVLGFTIQGSDKLKELLLQKHDRQMSWNKSVSKLNYNLDIEAANTDDILFLDVIDVYRNLPQKMLLFFKWMHYNARFSFFLKTDDDTFINVPLVEKELRRSLNASLSENVWWWSTFRIGWPIQTFGKWRENSYQSITYPPFPCGSGYVLSYGAVNYLGVNADHLYKNYQGEDVALGIWLASVHPITQQGTSETCVWNCSLSSAQGDVCNYPQLSSKEIMMWYKQILTKKYTVINS